MQPSCYYLHSSGTWTSLYLGETTTVEVLEVFPSESPVLVSEIGATVEGHGWFDAHQLPQIDKVCSLLEFLRTRRDIELIDFSAVVGRSRLSTHDDGEAMLLFPTQAEALSFLHRALDKTVADAVIAELLRNQGSYVTDRDGTFQAYETFDAYLAGDQPIL